MPLYDHDCPRCRSTFEEFRKAAYSGHAAVCPKCGTPSPKILSPSRVIGDYAPYECPITGKPVSGRKAHRENLAKHNCRVFETGEREGFLRRRAAEDTALDKRIEATVSSQIERMPGSQRESLGRELESGADISITRG